MNFKRLDTAGYPPANAETGTSHGEFVAQMARESGLTKGAVILCDIEGTTPEYRASWAAAVKEAGFDVEFVGGREYRRPS